MKKSNTTFLRTATAVLYLLAVLPVIGMATEVTFKGSVTYMDKHNLSLEKKFESAWIKHIRRLAMAEGKKSACRDGEQRGRSSPP